MPSQRPQRPSWKGFIRLSLVTVPVAAYNARVPGAGKVDLDWLHRKCHSRIHYKKVCPIHGEVSNDEIVSGYQYAKGKYVEIEPEELAKVHPQGDKAITVDVFVPSQAVDPIYFEKTYYLMPDGDIAQKPYAALHREMVELDRCAVAQVVLFGRDNLVLLRPYDGVLGMTTLSYEDEVREPKEIGDHVTEHNVSAKELELTGMLIESLTTKELDLSAYKDMYIDKLRQLVDAKVKGKEIVAPPQEEEPEVINLMEALERSVAKTKHADTVKPRHRARAPSTRHASARRKVS